MKTFLNVGRFVAFSLAAVVVQLWALCAGLVALGTPALVHGQFGFFKVVDGPAFSNVVATGKATADFGSFVGRTLDRVVLQLGGGAFTKAMISNVRVLANETVIYEDSGSRIDGRNQYRGLAAAVTFLTVDFSEIRAHFDPSKYAGALDTRGAGIARLTMEIDIAGATTPTLACQVHYRASPASSNALYNRLIGKVLNKTFNFAAAGEFPLPLAFARHPDSFVKRIHLFGATVTGVRASKTYLSNVREEFYKATATQNNFNVGEYQRTPQASVYHMDLIPDNDVRGALPLGDAASMEYLVTVSGAGNVTVVSELLDPLSNN